MTKLGLNGFVNKGELTERDVETGRVCLLLKQHVGAPAMARVAVGAKVKAGDVIAAPPDGQLGAVIHASISGTVTAVNHAVEITR
jgi:Na+-translocating ferredoxin:NAD+ oxidoreductase RnfC subunit